MAFRPKKAFVLAAGLGMRMRPLTNNIPKPLLTVGGRPMLDHVLDRLSEAGVERAVVNVHYLADRIISHLDRRAKPRIVISDERTRLLDTGGGVVKALPKLGSKPFYIHNSDSIWLEGVGRNLDRLAAAWQDDLMDSILLLAPGVTSVGYDGQGDFMLMNDGRIRRRRERECAPFVFTGVSIAHPRMFADAPDGPFSLNRLWDRAIEQDRLFGLRLEGAWMHVGTPSALVEAEQLIALDVRI
jgi:MurNAc alpha-1-phosphate uridylyltransferase